MNETEIEAIRVANLKCLDFICNIIEHNPGVTINEILHLFTNVDAPEHPNQTLMRWYEALDATHQPQVDDAQVVEEEQTATE